MPREQESDKKMLIRIETQTDEDEFEELRRQLGQLESSRVMSELIYPHAVGYDLFVPPPYETFITIVTVAANLATIAGLIIEYLIKPEKGKPKYATLKIDGKEITLKGEWKKEDVESILEKFSKILEFEEEKKEVSIIDEHRRGELLGELNELESVLPTYQKLVEIGKDLESKSMEAKKKFDEYRRRKAEIESRISDLKRLLNV